MTPPCDNEGSAAYPEYAELREEAERTCPRFVDPRGLLKDEEMRRRRGYDWCTAVLGRAYSPRAITTVDAHMLKIADERNLDPPLPQSILDARAEAQRREQKRTEQRQAYKERDVAAWADALEQCDVPVHVRPNTRGRRTPGHADGFNDGPLRHAVPDVDAMSGRSRRHPVGRALCETERRAKPRELGEPTDEPVTCKGCLKLAPAIRHAEPSKECPCCSARLCERGRDHGLGCGGVAAAGDRETVRDCPCSAATTEGTAAHRIRQEAMRRAGRSAG